MIRWLVAAVVAVVAALGTFAAVLGPRTLAFALAGTVVYLLVLAQAQESSFEPVAPPPDRLERLCVESGADVPTEVAAEPAKDLLVPGAMLGVYVDIEGGRPLRLTATRPVLDVADDGIVRTLYALAWARRMWWWQWLQRAVLGAGIGATVLGLVALVGAVRRPAAVSVVALVPVVKWVLGRLLFALQLDREEAVARVAGTELVAATLEAQGRHDAALRERLFGTRHGTLHRVDWLLRPVLAPDPVARAEKLRARAR